MLAQNVGKASIVMIPFMQLASLNFKETIIVNTSVVLLNLPTCEHIFHFSIFQIFKFLKIQQCKHIEGSTDFFASKPNFCNLFEIMATKHTQKSISSTP
jgi:hypothetical protein